MEDWRRSVWVTGVYDPETSSPSGAPAMVAPGWAISARATTFTRPRSWRSMPPPGRSRAIISTTRRLVGLGRGIAADHRRLHAQRKAIKGLIDVARDGYLWMLERTADKINFVAGKPFVYHNMYTGLDPKTGHPVVAPGAQAGTGKMADFCPTWGGKNWPPVAYSPKTQLLYIPANENLCAAMLGWPVTYTPGQPYSGVTVGCIFARAQIISVNPRGT